MSMTFYPGVKKEKRLEWVGDSDTFPNLSNSNAFLVWTKLGFKVDFEYGELQTVEIDDLIEAASSFLKAENEYLASVAGPHTLRGSDGSEFLEMGPPDDYFARRVQALLDTAIEGKRLGATCVYAA